jgi:tetratricopeptide (TPR) repeat protein
MEIAETVLTGVIEAGEGELQTAIATFESAVVMEDALPYSEPPEWFYPVRHALGAVQIETGDYAAAEATYQRDLEIMVENGWALRGLTQALTLQGKTEQAAAAQSRFDAAWANAEIELAGSVISAAPALMSAAN